MDLVVKHYLSSRWSMYVGLQTDAELINLGVNVKKQLAKWRDYAIDTNEPHTQMIRSICSYVCNGLNDYYCNNQFEGIVVSMYYGNTFCLTPCGYFIIDEGLLDRFVNIQGILRREEN